MSHEVQVVTKLLPVGARIRHVRHPELTGRIKAHEWAAPGKLSPIPYLFEWDDSSRASDVLGWFFFYGGPDHVEPIEAE